MSMLARTAAALGQIVLNTLVFPNGRRVRTTLNSIEAVETYERYAEYDLYSDWDRYDLEPLNEKHEIIEELAPVRGSIWEIVLKHKLNTDEYTYLYHEWDEQMAKEEAARLQIIADALEIEMYAKLERPRKRRQQPVHEYHIKRAGHRAANLFNNWSDELDRKMGLGNYKRYPKPEAA